MNRLSEFIERRRLVLAVLLALATCFGLVGISQIRFDFEPQAMFRQNSGDFALLRQVTEEFGPDDKDLLIVIECEDMFSPESLAIVRTLVERTDELPEIDDVFSIFDMRRRNLPALPLIPSPRFQREHFEAARKRALNHPLVAGHLLSSDGCTMLVIVRLPEEPLPISRVAHIVERLRQIVHDCTTASEVRARVTGHPAIWVDLFSNSQRETLKFSGLGSLVAVVIAIILFRRPAAVVIAVAGPVLGVTFTIGGMGFLGEPLNGINTVIPTLLFVIGFTDSIHLLMDFRRSCAASIPRRVAAKRAVRHLGLACALTSLTTAIGFGSLALADTESVRRFGITAAAGAILTFFSVISVVPLLASTWLGKLAVPQRIVATKWQQRTIWIRAMAPLLNYARPLTIVTGLFAVFLLFSAMQLSPDIRLTEAIPHDFETTRAMNHCDRAFGGILFAYVLLEWSESDDLDSEELIGVVQSIHRLIDDEPLTRSPASVLNLLQSVSRPDADLRDLANRVPRLSRIPTTNLQRIVRRDLRRLLISAHVPDTGAAALEPGFQRIEAGLQKLERAHSGFQLQLTGTSVVAARNVSILISDLMKSLGMAAVIVFLVITVVFRSIRLGLVSIFPNAFPLLLTAALLVWAQEPLRLAGVVSFSLCLGIAVDDTIHFLVRFQREQLIDGDVRSAVLRSFEAVGTPIMMTSLILLGGLGVMITSNMPAVRLFATLSSIAVIAALIGDLLILPALLVTFVPRPREDARAH